MATFGLVARLTVFVFSVCCPCIECFIQCPSCRDAGNVLECLQNSQMCPSSQVCYGTMSDFSVTMECGFPVFCDAIMAIETINCTSGTPFQAGDTCNFCCSDLDECRSQLEQVQIGIDGIKEVLHCPTCPLGTTDPYLCVLNHEPCNPDDKVCRIDLFHTSLQAGCSKDELLCKMQEAHSEAACAEEYLHFDAFCTRCCVTEDCWKEALRIRTNVTVTPVTTTTTTTTQAVVSEDTSPHTFIATAETADTSASLTNFFSTSIVTTASTTTTHAFVSEDTSALHTFTTTAEVVDTSTSATDLFNTTVVATSSDIPATQITTSDSTMLEETFSSHTPLTTTSSVCKDEHVIDCTRHNVCVEHASLAQQYCRRTCKFCIPEDNAKCEDHVDDDTCITTPNICQHVYAPSLCPLTCGFC